MAKNFGEIISNLSLDAGEAVRLNAGGTAFEGYTPFSESDVQRLIIDATPDADHTATGMSTASLNAGASISAFECVYLASDGEWAKADASATGTTDKLLAIALEAGTDGNPMDVALPGAFVRDDTWDWTVGGAIYLSETAGALTQTAPSTADSVVRVLGYALSADVMYFMPQTGVVHV